MSTEIKAYAVILRGEVARRGSGTLAVYSTRGRAQAQVPNIRRSMAWSSAFLTDEDFKIIELAGVIE